MRRDLLGDGRASWIEHELTVARVVARVVAAGILIWLVAGVLWH